MSDTMGSTIATIYTPLVVVATSPDLPTPEAVSKSITPLIGFIYNIINHFNAKASTSPDLWYKDFIAEEYFRLNPDSPIHPHPALKIDWWSKLKGEKESIYALKDGVQVYKSNSKNIEPTTMNFAFREGKSWQLKKNEAVAVWQKPSVGSGWICVFISPTQALWVRGEEMSPTQV